MMRFLFSLRTKLFLAFFLLSALIVMALSYVLFLHMRTNHLDTLKRSLTVVAGLAATQQEAKVIGKIAVMGEGENEAPLVLRALWQRLSGGDQGIERVHAWRRTPLTGEYAYIADSNGQRAGDSADLHRNVPSNAGERPVIAEFLNRWDDIHITAYAPVRNLAGEVIAVLGIEADRTAVSKDISHFAMQLFNLAAIALLVVGVISWGLARNFTRRLSIINAAVDEIAAGNLNIALSEHGNDEVALLAGQLNRLATTLHTEREEMLLSAIESLVAALEAKDAYTYGHSSQVSAISLAIAQELDVTDRARFSIQIAALLHDIGKIGIPDRVLNKPGRLDDCDRILIEEHPVIGAKILSGIPALAQVTDLVRHHHARWDGRGYPEPLTGEDIPLGARIIAVADTYQAMVSDRPYRKGLSDDVARAELSRCAGSQFDPMVVEAFMKILLRPDQLAELPMKSTEKKAAIKKSL